MEHILDKLKSGDAFSLVRFDDGELNCIMGREGANCDGCRYTYKLKRGLIKAIEFVHPNYLKAFGSGLPDCIGKKEMIKYTSQFKQFCPADIFTIHNREGKLFEFLTELKKEKVMFILPERISNVPSLLEFKDSVILSVPLVDAMDRIDNIINTINFLPMKPRIWLFSVGMCTEVLIHKLFKEFGDKHVMLDVGSIWDCYCGLYTRSYHYREDCPEMMARNLARSR